MDRAEVEEGKIYRCELSGCNVLVYDIEKGKTNNGKETIAVHGKYYNPVTGKYATDTFVDKQLSAPKDHIELQSSMNT